MKRQGRYLFFSSLLLISGCGDGPLGPAEGGGEDDAGGVDIIGLQVNGLEYAIDVAGLRVRVGDLCRPFFSFTLSADDEEE